MEEQVVVVASEGDNDVIQVCIINGVFNDVFQMAGLVYHLTSSRITLSILQALCIIAGVNNARSQSGLEQQRFSLRA